MINRAVKTLFLAFLLNPSSWAQSKQVVQIFELLNPMTGELCSATLFQYKLQFASKKCGFVTNAHCVKEASGVVINDLRKTSNAKKGTSAVLFFRPDTFNVKLVKSDQRYDLAELEIPRAISKEFCGESSSAELLTIRPEFYLPNFPEFGGGGRMLNRQYEALGVVDSKFVSTKGRGGAPEIFLNYNSSAALSKVEGLKIYKGMSGGAAFDDGNGLIGVNAWLRHKGVHQTFLIPIHSVIHFLERAPKKLDSSPAMGGNGHADGGGPRESLVQQDSIRDMSEFFFPGEGSPDPRDSRSVILAVDGISVYSREDLDYLNAWPNRLHVPTKKPVDSYLPEMDLVRVIDRLLKTSFFWSEAQSLKIYDRTSDSTYKLSYDKPIGAYFISRTCQSQIRIQFVGHDLGPGRDFPQRKESFGFEFVERGQKLKIRRLGFDSETLECQNSFYNVLNCRGPKSVLSFRLDQIRSDSLEFIYAINEGSRIIHHYGNLRAGFLEDGKQCNSDWDLLDEAFRSPRVRKGLQN